ncbi:MAG: nucleotidyltransferase domain-containing protein [Candidatus Hodarchaeota archaeon]
MTEHDLVMDVIRDFALSDKITPSQNFVTTIKEFHDYFPKIVGENAAAFPVKEVIPVGSTSRNTFLPGSTDLDYFVTLETDEKSLLESFTHKVSPKIATVTSAQKLEYLYAENPYARLIIPYKSEVFEVDLVTTVAAQNYEELKEALKISGMARTPFHTKWLSPKVKGLETEIRLLKYWLKQKRVYGTFGLTGFLCELLLIKYRTFENLLYSLNEGLFSNLVLEFDQSNDKELRKKFSNSKIIIVDPCDPERNAAAGIQGFMGDMKVRRLHQQAEYCLRNPNQMFDLLVVEPPYINVEIKIEGRVNSVELYTRLARYATKLRNTLKNEGYNLENVFIDTETSSIQLVLERYFQQETIIKGPPIRIKDAAERFRNKHKHVEDRQGWLYAVAPPKYPSASDVIAEYLKLMKTTGTIELKVK